MSTAENIEKSTTPLTLKDVRSVYFIGIGGIGMSAIARYFHAKGIAVSGYDKTPTDLTKELEASGISIHYNEDVAGIPKDADIVVYTPAVPQEHAELVYFREHGYKVVKRSDVLQIITADSFNICIAGTHGKTTITTMTGHILRHSGYGCNVFLGGISVNYGTNFWSSEKNVVVVEADEYDRSFLKLSPNIAVISAMDADHLDIYGDEKTMQDAFVDFGNKLGADGLLISKFGLKRIREIHAKNKISYSLGNDAASAFAFDVQIKEGGYLYSVQLPDKVITGLELRIGGMHNVENSVAAIAIANALEIEEDKIREAVKEFKGVKRRFEYIIAPEPTQKGAYVQPVFIDDYAHHPEELKALLSSARTLFPQRKITVLFQPHLYTRTRDLSDGFASSLSIADQVVLLPIYPARELPIEGVNSELILKKVEAEKNIVAKEDLVAWMKEYATRIDKEFGEVIIAAGAGDITTIKRSYFQRIVSRKISIKKVLIAAAWLAVGSGLLTLLIAANQKKKEHLCKDVQIIIKGTGENFFIDKGDIITLLKGSEQEKLIGRSISKMNLGKMEQQLERSSWIADAELYIDGKDVLHVTAIERQPIARVFTKAGTTFYIDTAAKRLPILQKVSVRVPVVTNFPYVKKLSAKDSALLMDVKSLSQFVISNEFWNAQVAQIDIVGERNFEIIPTVGNHIIKLGTAENLEQKFARLMIFYKQVLSKTGFDKYSAINVAYDGQVIGEYKGATSVVDSLQLAQNIKAMMERSQNDAAQQPMDIDSTKERTDSIQYRSVDTSMAKKAVTTIIQKPVVKTPSNTTRATAKPNPILKKTTTTARPTVKPKTVQKNVVKKGSVKPKAVMPKKTVR
jgi:UDP-N-acetylmuramate--alanine ligase